MRLSAVVAACFTLACSGGFAGLGATRPAWEVDPPPALESPVVRPGALTRAELPNGLHVIILEDHRLPRIVLSLDVRRGAASVDPAEAGLASFTSELMKRGAGDRDALELAEATDEIGAVLSVGAGWDEMGAAVSGLARDTAVLFEILGDVVLRPTFAAAEANRARAQRLAALERARDNAATVEGWNVVRALYGGHRYGLPRNGTAETVARLGADRAREFHHSMFIPNAAVFSAAGDVDADEILARVKRMFGSDHWQAGEVPSPGPPAPQVAPESRRIVIVDRPDLAQARITLAHEGISRTNPDRIAAALMNGVLGGSGFSSRLMSVVRSDAGLTYTIGSGFSLRRSPGPFAVSTFTRVAEVRNVIDLVIGELERGRDEPPTEAELAEARTLSVGRFSMGLETSDAVMSSLVDLDLYRLPEDSLDTYRGRVRAVTTADTAKMAKQLLHPERAVIVLVGPASELLPQVEDLGPVEVVQP